MAARLKTSIVELGAVVAGREIEKPAESGLSNYWARHVTAVTYTNGVARRKQEPIGHLWTFPVFQSSAGLNSGPKQAPLCRKTRDNPG